jgi:hypothetical protein
MKDMRNAILYGIGVGIIVSGLAWLTDNSRVSVFPDVVSMLTFVVLSAIALRQVLRPGAGAREITTVASTFGAAMGAIIGVSTVVRGAVQWTRADVRMMIVGFVVTFVVVVIAANVIAWLARPTSRESAPSPSVPTHRSR